MLRFPEKRMTNDITFLQRRIDKCEEAINNIPLSLVENSPIIVRIDERVQALVREVADVKLMITANYVRREEFDPVKDTVSQQTKVIYGVVTSLIVAVVTGILAFFMKQ